MLNIKKNLVLAAVLIATCFSITTKAYAIESKKRISGLNRYQTAVEVSKEGWRSSETVILANGENFPDALCAAPLARKYKAPILLTPSTYLDPEVESEINRLGAKEIVIVGGTGVVSSDTENKLRNKGLQVSRIAGSNRFETSLEIARRVKGTGSEIAVVSSEGYADALSVAPIAANRQMPIILLPKDSIPNNIAQYIKDNNITKTYVIGGDGVLPDTLVSKLPGTKRVAGYTRYLTNVEVIKEFASDISFKTSYLAYGDNFPDALACSALAPVTSSPIILLPYFIPTETDELVREKYYDINNFKVVGGKGIIPDSLIKQMIHGFGVEAGNTSSNLTNYGLAVEKDGWVYYTDQSDYQRIYKMKVGDSKGQRVSDDPYANQLNVIGNWIYYVDSEGTLCRMKTNGSNVSTLTDYPVYFMQANSDYIYFFTKFTREKNGYPLQEMHRIKPDGSGDEVAFSYNGNYWDYAVVDNDTYYLSWDYNAQSNNINRFRSSTGTPELVIKNADKFVVSNDNIYYISHEDKCIYRADVNGQNITKITDDTAVGLNVSGGLIYYVNSSDGNKLYKISIEGKDKSKVSDVMVSPVINIAGGKVFYVESNQKYDTFYMNKDGSSKSNNSMKEAASINVYNSETYYINFKDFFIYKADADGNNEISLNQKTTHSIQIKDGWIYYSNLNDNNRLYKMKTDGSSNTKISDSSSGEFGIIGESIYYSNLSDKEWLYKIKIDGTDTVKLLGDNRNINRFWAKDNYLVFSQVPKYGDSKTMVNTSTYLYDFNDQYPYIRSILPGNIYNLSIVGNKIFYSLIDGDGNIGNIKVYDIGNGSNTDLNIQPVNFVADETGIYYLSVKNGDLGYIIKTDLTGNNQVKIPASANTFNLYIKDNGFFYQTIDISQTQRMTDVN